MENLQEYRRLSDEELVEYVGLLGLDENKPAGLFEELATRFVRLVRSKFEASKASYSE